MYRQPDRALHVLDNAVQVRDHADLVWRSAIREAIASNVPVEQVAAQARTTIERVIAIINEPYVAGHGTAGRDEAVGVA